MYYSNPQIRMQTRFIYVKIVYTTWLYMAIITSPFLNNLEELADVDRINLKASRQCLYIPPQAPEEYFNREHENRLAAEHTGGFIICLWQKPY